jgi:hypothetical protein
VALIDPQVRREVTHLLYELVHVRIKGRQVNIDLFGERGVGREEALLEMKSDADIYDARIKVRDSVLNVSAGDSRPRDQ